MVSAVKEVGRLLRVNPMHGLRWPERAYCFLNQPVHDSQGIQTALVAKERYVAFPQLDTCGKPPCLVFIALGWNEQNAKHAGCMVEEADRCEVDLCQVVTASSITMEPFAPDRSTRAGLHHQEDGMTNGSVELGSLEGCVAWLN